MIKSIIHFVKSTTNNGFYYYVNHTESETMLIVTLRSDIFYFGNDFIYKLDLEEYHD